MSTIRHHDDIPGIDLTRHLKIWFGEEFREEHIARLIRHKTLNPHHDILLVVNKFLTEKKIFISQTKKIA